MCFPFVFRLFYCKTSHGPSWFLSSCEKILLSEKHSNGATMIIVVKRSEGFLKILLLRVRPSRFSRNPNRATRPIIIVCLLPSKTRVLNLPGHSALKNQNKKVSVLYVFFFASTRTFFNIKLCAVPQCLCALAK